MADQRDELLTDHEIGRAIQRVDALLKKDRARFAVAILKGDGLSAVRDCLRAAKTLRGRVIEADHKVDSIMSELGLARRQSRRVGETLQRVGETLVPGKTWEGYDRWDYVVVPQSNTDKTG